MFPLNLDKTELFYDSRMSRLCCDACGRNRMPYYRYRCLRCPNYTLCPSCHNRGVRSGRHEWTHPFQCLLSRAGLELFFAGEAMPALCADSFTCPMCGDVGFTSGELIKHCHTMHRVERKAVICPLCVAKPSPGRGHLVGNICTHFDLWHSTSSPHDNSLFGFQWPSGGPEISNTGTIFGTGTGTGSIFGTGTGTGTATHHTLPTAQIPQVRFLLPTGSPPLAIPEDLSDYEL
ncbi:E3 ubiquitin-protein ligase KCMF1 [Drosophila eugracilis]|uniref:E3 ubiquitin-protein ligase KCMF1 n=1 Tax=Drosophila eugracilis TaxID=29029 RepID=UPI0007E850BA|nr:E3 ubiquitin-protein ligase KCMF1 [Drosophila eugracilis]